MTGISASWASAMRADQKKRCSRRLPIFVSDTALTGSTSTLRNIQC